MSTSASIRFEGRVAIVTGSGRGLGRQHALLLARLGASVVVNSTTAASSQATVDDIVKAGGKAIACVGSVSDPAVANDMVQKAIDTFGHIDIIVNNAGFYDPKPFEQITPAEFRELFAVHVEGSFNLTKAAWPHMQKQKYGRVVMITSHTMFGMTGATTYAAVKMALIGMAKSLAVEGAAHNILVNAVATTGFTDTVEKNTPDQGTQAFMKANFPASEPAPAVVWLAHEDAKVSGEVFGAQGRIVTRIFVAESHGFQGSSQGGWTIEDVRDNWDQVMNEKDYTVPQNTEEMGALLFQRLSTGST